MNLFTLFYNNLIDSRGFKILIITIIFDVIFGILRSIREHKINSTIGIDGIIRKTGMLLSVIFLTSIDCVIHLDLIGFVPVDVKGALNLDYVGFYELFNLLFILFEFLSILKNMVLCKLPIPSNFQKTLETFFRKFTGELDKVIELKVTVPEKKEGE